MKVMDRFLKYVDKGGPGGCWLWTGVKTSNGYGRFRLGSRTDGSRRSVSVHRFMYERTTGPIPDGLVIDHLCRVRNCVNPAHMEPVTNAENVCRGKAGEHWAEKTHCPRGHEYTPENTYLAPSNGARNCRACARGRDRDAKQRRRDALRAQGFAGNGKPLIGETLRRSAGNRRAWEGRQA